MKYDIDKFLDVNSKSHNDNKAWTTSIFFLKCHESDGQNSVTAIVHSKKKVKNLTLTGREFNKRIVSIVRNTECSPCAIALRSSRMHFNERYGRWTKKTGTLKI
jgi:hypothetical protein